MHPLTMKLLKVVDVQEEDRIIRSHLTERAEWLKVHTTSTPSNPNLDHLIDQAFQLTTETCEKCGQVIKEPQ